MPREVGELVPPDDHAVVCVDDLPISPEREAGDLFERSSRLARAHELRERELSLPNTDRVVYACLKVHLRRHTREPTAGDGRQVRVGRLHALGRTQAVGNLVPEEAGHAEAERTFASFDEAAQRLLR